MRIAAMAVGAAVVGSLGVLLSLAPAAPAAAEREPERPAESEAGAVAVEASCPPCRQGPMGPIGWMHAVSRPEAQPSLVRAAALSLAMGEPRVVEQALQAEDPALRELAALLLNVASGRVAGCTPVGSGGHVAQVLDQLDRLLARVRDGEPVAAEEVGAAAAAASFLNRGEGLPDSCSG